MEPIVDVEDLISTASQDRSSTTTRRARIALGLSGAFTIGWVIYVSASSQWGRVGDQWASAVTMIFGSFVAGSTPQGGGAVAFPVFTKLLEVPADVARTFSLSIQSVGMTAASLAILINRRRIVPRAIAIAGPAAIAGLLIAYLTIVKTDLPFGPTRMPGAYVKVLFTVIVAAMAFVTYLGYRVQILERRDELPPLNARLIGLLVGCGLAGGFTSMLVGSGADVFVYLALVVLVGISPRTGVATSVLIMTAVSLVGLGLLGLGDGHLNVQRSEDGQVVTHVADRPITIVGDPGTSKGSLQFTDSAAPEGRSEAPESSRFDLFGLWLAAAPVVVWGAPLGSAVSSRVTDRQLVRFVVVLALAETVSTIVFLDELRSDAALATFGMVAITTAFVGLWLLGKYRRRILGLPKLDPHRSITRSDVDVGPNLGEHLKRR